jgi:hypothetical protein
MGDYERLNVVRQHAQHLEKRA